ncbi:tRNA pseudouridine synthase A [Candidatus Jidaibacter acanthamoeba]|uniref:tRNA pseudouridine synthase A n=1 Tax=Candidatus Jidaibacter acanthamoebae TaxID=86105 RepID=A0A0C1QM24_9RICK|nr:tRNA pseudouridine synthase A [Candidatus Jidaibacter acanthamoeba]
MKLKRYRITIEYDGTGLVGWQRQRTGISVQGLIEESIYKLSMENVTVYGAGRTDAGVHAYAQVAHFDLVKEFPPHKIRDALNHFLQPNLVSIIKAEQVASDFHARFDAKQRSYIYKIVNRSSPLTLDNNKAWHVIKKLNIRDMQEAADFLIGKHDLSSFRSVYCQSDTSIKSIDEIKILENCNEVLINIAAPSFLHNQVRIIVGTLVKIGKGEWNVEKMKEIIAARNRTAAGSTAPPYGLYFKNVIY